MHSVTVLYPNSLKNHNSRSNVVEWSVKQCLNEPVTFRITLYSEYFRELILNTHFIQCYATTLVLR